MSNSTCICKIVKNGKEYPIKDSVSREEIEKINSEITIINGDSYGNEKGEWSYLLKDILVNNSKTKINPSDIHIWCEGGSSAIKRNDGNYPTYLENMVNNEDVITDKSKVTRIILCGGYNDSNNDETAILNALATFHNYCRENYPNAKVYYGMIGWDASINNNGKRNNINNKVLPAFRNCSSFGGYYLSNVEYLARCYSPNFWKDDNYHPNTLLSQKLANGIYQALVTGSCTNYQGVKDHYLGQTVFTNGIKITTFIDGKTINYNSIDHNSGGVINELNLTPKNVQTINLGSYETSFIRYVNTLSFIPINLLVTGVYANGTTFKKVTAGTLQFKQDGNVYINYLDDALQNYSLTDITLLMKYTTDLLFA